MSTNQRTFIGKPHDFRLARREHRRFVEVMMKTTTKILLIGLAMVATGCATWDGNKTVRRASIVEFLYPNKQRPVEKPTVPILSLPMDVGVVFVPENSPSGNAVLTEKQKIRLMEQVAAQFKRYSFIRSVNPIPTLYLRPGGGFENLDALGTMFGVDVIVVLSYDQAQFTDTHQLPALMYWTLVGAYSVPAERNTTHTMVDAAVYHLPSRKMLFRAPGISRVQRHSTPVDVTAARRDDSETGFKRASADLADNLKGQLDVFREKARNTPDQYKVEAKPGYDLKAVGAIDPIFLLMLLAIAGGLYLCLQPQNSR
jgi:rhombotail lipoprotein